MNIDRLSKYCTRKSCPIYYYLFRMLRLLTHSPLTPCAWACVRSTVAFSFRRCRYDTGTVPYGYRDTELTGHKEYGPRTASFHYFEYFVPRAQKCPKAFYFSQTIYKLSQQRSSLLDLVARSLPPLSKLDHTLPAFGFLLHRLLRPHHQ